MTFTMNFHAQVVQTRSFLQSKKRVLLALALLSFTCNTSLLADGPNTKMPPLIDVSPIRIVEGPVLLHANAAGEWGGHTFSYLLTGEKDVFWAAMLYEPGRTSRTMLIGQHPEREP